MSQNTKRMVKALDEAGVYLRPHEGEKYVNEIADAVFVLYKHMCSLSLNNQATWDIPTLELLSIFGRAEGTARFTPDPPAPPPEPLRVVSP